MARIGVRHVHRAVGIDLDREIVGRQQFDADPAGHHVLVVDRGAGGQVLAPAVMIVIGHRGADADLVADGRGEAGDEIMFVVAAVRGARIGGELIGQVGGDIFDRAADRVAAVKRALRTAQYFDLADIVNIEDRGLRAGIVNVVDVNADARLGSPGRILLADASDIGGQGRVRAAPDEQAGRGRQIGQIRDILGTLGRQLVFREGADRHRRILEAFGDMTGRHRHFLDRIVVGMGRKHRQTRANKSRGGKQAGTANPWSILRSHGCSPVL